MKVVNIPKRGGGIRTIYVQSPREKPRYRLIGARINQILDSKPTADCLHGFRPGRSPVTNAQKHVGFKYTLSMDIEAFFDNVKQWHLEKAGAGTYASGAIYKGAARQGLSSSPAAANLAGTLLDEDIISSLPNGAVYTRYADDLTISCNDLVELIRLRELIPTLANKYEWKIKKKKTRIQSQKYGDRIICGIAVGRDSIHVPRSTKRILRAAMHKYPDSNKTNGIAEWCKLKPPTGETFGKWAIEICKDETRKAFLR